MTENGHRMRRAKTIDELYREIRDRDCDMVLVSDPSLAQALNRLVDFNLLGEFAQTPSRMVEKRGTFPGMLDVVRRIVVSTGLDFRYVHGEYRHIREILRHDSDVESHISHSPDSLKVWEVLSRIDTLESEMAKGPGSLYDGRRVAVVGRELMDQLESGMLPREYADIGLFHEDCSFSLDVIYEVGNDRQLSGNVVSLITGDPGDYALVLNPSSSLDLAVKFALSRRGIPYTCSTSLRDSQGVRCFLSFVSFAFDYRRQRVSDVVSLFGDLGGGFPEKSELRLLSSVELEGRSEVLRDLMSSIPGRTYSEVADVLFTIPNGDVSSMLSLYGFGDVPVSESTYRDLRYMVDSMPELGTFGCESAGRVLLVDSSSSVCVERGIVFFLGMGSDWNQNIAGKRYVDADRASEKEASRLGFLLQQGSVRGYFVNTIKNGRSVKPCRTFSDLCGGSVGSFRELTGNLVRGRWTVDEPVESEPIGCPRDIRENGFNFSKSSFDKYMECPRKFMFSRLLSSESSVYTLTGTLLHEFAEVYFSHPDIVRDRMDEVEAYMRERTVSLSFSVRQDIDLDRLFVMMSYTMSFIDSVRPDDLKLEPFESEGLCRLLGIREHSGCCEKWLNTLDGHMNGRVDLIMDGRIYDFKTGRANDGDDVFKKMDFDPKTKNKTRYIDTQPIFYLALGMESETEADSFTLVYVSGDQIRGITDGFSQPKQVLVRRGDEPFDDMVLEVIGRSFRYDGYPELDVPEFKDAYFKIVRGMVEKGSYTKTQSEKCLKAIGISDVGRYHEYLMDMKKLVKDSYTKGVVIGTREVIIPTEKVSEFKRRVNDVRIRESIQYGTDYPADPFGKCDDCEYGIACTRTVISLEEGESDE